MKKILILIVAFVLVYGTLFLLDAAIVKLTSILFPVVVFSWKLVLLVWLVTMLLSWVFGGKKND